MLQRLSCLKRLFYSECYAGLVSCFCVHHLYANVYRLNLPVKCSGEESMKKKSITSGAVAATAAAIMIVLFVVIAVSGAIVSSQTIQMSGIIASTNVGVYSDSACTQSLTSISWGTISPGASVTRTVYVRNIGTTSVTLSMSQTNWNPETANGPINLVWNQESTVLNANQVATATLTLSTSSTVNGITTFSVDIVISGTA
jgi:hypothetical protein